MKRLILLFSILLFAGTANAATLYVAQTAAGSGDGSTYANRMSVASHNAATFAAGDIIVLGGGDITSQVVAPSSGSSGNPIIYQNYETTPAIIKVSSSSGAFRLADVSYVTVDGLDIRNGNIGIALYQVANILIKNCYIYNMSNKGIHATTGTGRNSYITIGGSTGNGNDVYQCGSDTGGGDYAFNKSDDIIISYNKGRGNPASYGTDGVVMTYCNRVLIEYNWFYDHANGYPIGEDGIDIKGVTDAIIRYNVCWNHRQEGIKINFYEPTSLSCDTVVIYHNLVYNNRSNFSCSGGDVGEEHDNIYWWGNISHSPTSGSNTTITTRGTNIQFHNNTLFGNLAGKSSIYTSRGTNFDFFNNIIVGTGTDRTFWVGSNTGYDIDNNLYYRSGSTPNIYLVDTEVTLATVDAGYINANPLFTDYEGNDFTLTATSPAIEAGTSLAALSVPSITVQGVQYDFSYNSILTTTPDWTVFPPSVTTTTHGATWTVGAYLYGEGSSPVPPVPPDPPGPVGGMAKVNDEAAALVNDETLAIVNSIVPDTSAPTVDSAVIGTTGLLFTLNFDKVVTGGAGFTITPSGAAATLTYASGTGTAALVYDLSREIEKTETATFSYSTVTGDVVDSSSNALAAITDAAVLNYSQYEAEPEMACNTAFFSETAAHSAQYEIKTATDRVYRGQKDFVPPSNGDLCSYQVYMTKTAGSITGLAFRMEVWSRGATTDNLGTLLATSTAITGVNEWSFTSVTFEFPAGERESLSTGSAYHIVVTHNGAVGSTNKAAISTTGVGVGTLPGTTARWDSSGVFDSGENRDVRGSGTKMGAVE